MYASSPRALAVAKPDEAARHLGDKHDVVFGWRLDIRQLRVLGEKVPIPFIGQHRTAEDRGHGRKIVKTAGPHEHRHIVARQTAGGSISSRSVFPEEATEPAIRVTLSGPDAS